MIYQAGTLAGHDPSTSVKVPCAILGRLAAPWAMPTWAKAKVMSTVHKRGVLAERVIAV